MWGVGFLDIETRWVKRTSGWFKKLAQKRSKTARIIIPSCNDYNTTPNKNEKRAVRFKYWFFLLRRLANL